MDNLTKAQRRKNMQNIRSEDTLPEKKLAKTLRAQKLYFAQYVKSLPGKPDIVFRRRKVAVFVDSDFWHGHPKRFIKPRINQSYWLPKIARNKQRDKEVNRELRKNGWKVLRIWEHAIKKDAQKCLHKIIGALQ